jgi:phosphate/phosphite/phosphonate ABC transporter binding protein
MGLVAAQRSGAEGADLYRRLERSIEGAWQIRRFPSYSTLVDALCEEEIDLAWLPPVAYLRARQLGPVHLLLAVERGGPTSYGSALLASQRAGVVTLDDIRGKRVAWVDVWSAAGYLMPRSVIREAGFDPETIFASQTFVGSHAAVLDALQEGRAEIGATYCSLDRDGALVAAPWTDRPEVRPFALSGAIPGDAICAAGELHLEDAVAMVEPLVALSSEPQGSALLTRIFGAGYFVEVDPSYYQVLEGV